ncbi:sugar kinase [Rubrobacter xylanophilus]|uniref:Sugar kinase n=1 Tax=Rubrobacter xylanophilus TaxID=49319 RepID=A0A510HLP8_9ACTN|nr:sugar kinase [Rubrobacter xylanophilus]
MTGHLRRHNRSVVLELIRTRGPLSRAALVEATNLSLPTVIEIVEQLENEGLVRKVGEGPSTGGRRPALIELVPDAFFALGVELGTRTTTVVLTDLRAVVRARESVPSRMSEGPEATYERMVEALRSFEGQLSGPEGKVLGIGVAFPAPVLDRFGAAFSPPSYPGWGEIRVGELLSRRYGLPVIVDNDANARAIGEHLFGVGQGHDDMFYFVCHRGVGGAAIMDGRLRRGAHGGAGEIGHTLVDPEGPRCGCGRYGCLEAFVGRAAIARRARRLFSLSGRSGISGVPLEEVKAEHVIRAACEGDELAAQVIRETGRYLGVGIANVANLFDPSLVVVGGSTAVAGDLLLEPAREVLRERGLGGIGEEVQVLSSRLGEDAGAVGAAALVLQELFAVRMG